MAVSEEQTNGRAPQGPGHPAWLLESTEGMFIVPMVGMLLVVALIIGAYLPKITGHWATLAVPLAAALGLVALARRRKPQVTFEAGTLILARGNKRLKLHLPTLRFGYARWRTPAPGGLAGTVLLLQDGNTNLTVGGHRFLFDVPDRYQVNDTDHSEVHMKTEADFREFTTYFEGQVRAYQPQSADLAQVMRADSGPPEHSFQLGALWIVVKSGQVALYDGTRLVSTTPTAQLRWSAACARVTSGESSYLMPVVSLQLPGAGALTVGTYSQDAWSIDASPIEGPQFLLGVAEWLQLARALGVAQYLQ